MAYQVISPIMNHFLANNMCKDYTDVRGEKTMLIQLTPPTNAQWGQPMYFDSQTMLNGDNALITGIELVSATTLAKSPDGLTPMDISLYPYGTLVISDVKRDLIAQLPLQILRPSLNGGKIKFTYFNTQLWQNCYVTFAQAPFSSPLIPIQFLIYYTPKQKD